MRNHSSHLFTVIPLACIGHLLTACTQSPLSPLPDNPGVTEQALSIKELADQCGLECPANGIADGNAQISGVASVDAFFSSVVHYRSIGLGVSDNIDAQLAAIRADFGIAADADFDLELQAQFDANLESGFRIEAEPVRCTVDTQATVEAAAKCDTTVEPAKVMLACSGSCEVTASAEASCTTDADLECTVAAPSVDCKGRCQGVCRVALAKAAKCDGICEGECDSTCSRYRKGADGGYHSNGRCRGLCTGACTSAVATAAACAGKCEGECTTTNPTAGCQTATHVECKAKAGAMVMCDGRCQGEVVPPKAKVECEASAKADAKVNVLCTPPRLVAHYDLKVVVEGSVEAEAQAKFVAAVTNLETRLPLLLASLERGRSVATAGVELVAAAKVAVKGSVELAAKGKIDIDVAIGLGCALTQLDDVAKATAATSDRLKASIDSSDKLTTACGLGA